MSERTKHELVNIKTAAKTAANHPLNSDPALDNGVDLRAEDETGDMPPVESESEQEREEREEERDPVAAQTMSPGLAAHANSPSPSPSPSPAPPPTPRCGYCGTAPLNLSVTPVQMNSTIGVLRMTVFTCGKCGACFTMQIMEVAQSVPAVVGAASLPPGLAGGGHGGGPGLVRR